MSDEDNKPVGRPLKFESVEVLEELIEAFFEECNESGDPYTITGLALALDTSRKVLCEYEERDEFSNAVKRAKLRVENYAEKRLFGMYPTGPIFALKNFGWTDKKEIDHNHALTVFEPDMGEKKLNEESEDE